MFYGLDGLAALISVPVWVLVGWWFGKNIDEAMAFAKSMQKYVIAGLVVAIVGYITYRYWKKRRSKVAADSSVEH